MNAKSEFLTHIEGEEIICARIGIEGENYGSKKWFFLKDSFSEDDFKVFCDSLDFEYDEGYGHQKLFGVILFKDSYSGRGEYDGSEWWENYKMPTKEQVLGKPNN